MSRIDELIEELCPDGVHHLELGEVASYSDTRVEAQSLEAATFVGVDNLVADKRGRAIASYAPNTSRLAEYLPGDVLIGNIRPYLKKIWLATDRGGCSGDVLCIRIKENERGDLLPKFLYYLLSSDDFFTYDMQHAKGAKMPRGDKAAILRYRVPVPPLEVQREIVRILDKFTQLEAELEAELEKRRQQYAYYRDYLLDPSGGEGTNRVRLCDIGTFTRGRRFTKRDMVPEGIPCIHYGEIYTGYKTSATSTFSFVREELESGLRFAQPNDVVIAGVGETVEDVGKSVAWLGDTPAAIHDDSFAFGTDQDPTFIAYAMQSAEFHTQKDQFVSRAKVKRIGRAGLGKITIPLPPLKEQQRIVGVLDKFDALVNDLSVGLPAELDSRRKQYEYYRDLLLTFKELPA